MALQKQFKVVTEPQIQRRSRTETEANKAIDLELGRRIQSGDTQARNELVEKYLPFAFKVAAAWQRRNPSILIDDLVQEANIGLMTAADKFDPERELAFTTYATWWVNSTCQRWIKDNSKGAIRVPSNAQDRLKVALDEGTLDDTDDKSLDIARAANVRTISIEADTEQTGMVFQLADPEYGEGNSDERMSELVELHMECELVRDALWELHERNRLILECRFYKCMTLEEVAKFLHRTGYTPRVLSRERIRQIEEKLLTVDLPRAYRRAASE